MSAMYATIILEYRRERGWTQHQLAVRAGLHRVTIGRLERGYVPMWGGAIQAIAKAFDMTADELTEEASRRARGRFALP